MAGEAAAAGAAGAFAVGGPYGALIGGASQVLGAALSPRPAAPSTAISDTVVNSWFDGSGWTVATGQGKAEGGDRADGFTFNPLLAAAALVAFLIWKKYK